MTAENEKKHDYMLNVVPGNKKIKGTAEDDLLTLFTENSIMLRADCGGKGVCRKCLVKIKKHDEDEETVTACTTKISEDLTIEIPPTSFMASHVMKKAPVVLPSGFTAKRQTKISQNRSTSPGIAIDLGTTTIALYLLDMSKGVILSSIAMKNPQSMYGDDVMSRISYIGKDDVKLKRLQQLVIGSIIWGIESLLKERDIPLTDPYKALVVGNPTMIHILLGVSPYSLGIFPYEPEFHEAQTCLGKDLSDTLSPGTFHTLPQISGFIGSDILAAAIACDLEDHPVGTLLIDLGTNGELIMKSHDGFVATSCATGPAFEGATISCGMQAVPGAINRIAVNPDHTVEYSTIRSSGSPINFPGGICGAGIISGIASFIRAGIITTSGAYNTSQVPNNLKRDKLGLRYILCRNETGEEIYITQKDIRHIQLGKAALITGIKRLLASAGLNSATNILVAGAFGTYLDEEDLITLGMLPDIEMKRVKIAGNAAGAGATMVLYDDYYLNKVSALASKTTVLNLAADTDFQTQFLQQLSF